jgi:hypothetical protein
VVLKKRFGEKERVCVGCGYGEDRVGNLVTRAKGLLRD